MFNISRITWPTVVLIQILCWFAIVGKSEKFISIIDDEFSFKAIVESYDETGHDIVGRTLSTELYSSEYRRGVVKLLASNNRLIEYYYDGDLNGTLLEVFPDENLCVSSSQYDLHLNLYHSLLFPVIDDIYKAACPECENQSNTKHLIGAAKILVLVQMLRPKFGRPLGISTRDGSNRAVYHRANIEIGEDKSASIELFVHYDKVLDATSKLSDQIQPQYVRLNYTTKGGYSRAIGITFYQFNPLLDSPTEEIQRPLSLPTGMYCSRAIGSSLGDNKQEEVRMIQEMFMHIERFSFTAKIESSAVKICYAFDLSAKLIRKDSYIEDIVSETIYDIKTKLKYNRITSRDHPPETKSECVVDKMDDLQSPTIESNEKFINFEQLAYLGRARINSIDALIFEEYSTRYNSSGMQFWIKPPVWARPVRDFDPNFRADETRGGHSYTTYYFATGLGNSSATGKQTIGPLIQIEITIRDAISRIVWQQRMTISEFIVGRLTESHPKLNPVQMFSLESMNCRFKHQKRGKVSAVLESNLTTYVSPSLLDSNERNELIIKALDKEYAIRRIQLDQLSTKLKTTSEGDKYVIELEFTISQNVLDEQMNMIECVYLGRGKPITYDSPGFKHYTGIATFEDCMWLAHQHSSSNLNGDQVLFIFTDRLKCLVDRLYRHKNTPKESGSSDKSLNLNYCPYEHGSDTNNQRIFTIRNSLKKWPVGSPSDGMHFFQVGSRKLIGQNVELKLPGANQESINLKFSKMTLSGYLARVFNENFQPMGRITDLSWSESDIMGNKTNKLIALPTKSMYPLRLESQMNEAYCRSHCLTDLSCNSYSYCDRLDARKARCLISSINVSKTIVMKQLENLKDNLMRKWSNERNRNRVRKAKIMFDEGSLQQPEIEVVLDRTCSISAKSHIDLFKQTYPVKVEGAMIESIDRTIKSKDECARKCFSKNIDCLMKVANLKLGIADNQPISWESISNLAQEHMRGFCTGFLYTLDEHISFLNGSACLLTASQSVTDNQSQGRTPTGASVVDETIQSISMYLHKFVYSDLFWRLPGLRMRDSSEFEEFIKVDNREKLLELHSMGLNSQNKLPVDDVEFCARACILQLHGPRPMCSSFDFVHEQMGNTLIKYCLLNSQSFHDLQLRGQILDQQVLHEHHDNVTFWHFEPQDTALQISDPLRIVGVGDNARENHVKNYHPSALISLSFVLKLVGLVSGLIIGAKLTGHILGVSETIDESLTPKGKTARLIHRLSGVSLRSNLREVEVQMS